MNKSAKMRELLARPGMFILPGVCDALGARIVEEAGFEAVYVSGWAVEASYGKPDMGLLTMTEVVSRAASIAEAVDIPVFCDADTGYGSAINVIRTVREFERAAVAGIHLEDQALPKRCGQFPGRRLISTEEMVGKLRAALDARTNPNFIIMARTDAIDFGGIETVIERGRAYIKAGADAIWPIMHQNPHVLDDVSTVCSSFTKPTMLSIAEGGVQPMQTFAELDTIGLKVVLVPVTMLFSAVTAMRRAAKDLKQLGFEGMKHLFEVNDSWDSILKLVHQDHVLELTERYSEQAMEARE